MTLTRQAFLDLMSLSDVFLSMNDQRLSPPEKNNAALDLTTTMILPTDVSGIVISTKLENEENAVPFTTMTTATLSEDQPKYTFD